MRRREALAILAVFLIVVAMPIAIFGYQSWLRPRLAAHRVIDITAAAPEAGGFQPASIKVETGETVTLRFTSVDVTHGIAIGPGLGVDLGHVDPGHVKEITLTFDESGTYTFYCNSWCSPDHWRMRGILEVFDPDHPNTLPVAQRDPVIDNLIAEGVNIDAAHTGADSDAHDHELKFERVPSAAHGAEISTTLSIPADLLALAWQRTHTPHEALELLAAANPTVATADLLDVIAWLWTGKFPARQFSEAAVLYNKNCAACHGATGGGDGPAAGSTIEKPIAFSELTHIFERRGDALYAKIRRGGMGTDMPNFGTLFTPEETWLLVNYLWTLALDPTHQATSISAGD